MLVIFKIERQNDATMTDVNPDFEDGEDKPLDEGRDTDTEERKTEEKKDSSNLGASGVRGGVEFGKQVALMSASKPVEPIPFGSFEISVSPKKLAKKEDTPKSVKSWWHMVEEEEEVEVRNTRSAPPRVVMEKSSVNAKISGQKVLGQSSLVVPGQIVFALLKNLRFPLGLWQLLVRLLLPWQRPPASLQWQHLP
jgi:hypothetical protein